MDTTVEPPLFSSPAALRTAFEDGLADMLQHELLGVFILVLANAAYDPTMFTRLRRPLRDSYRRWSARFDAGDPLALQSAPDDVDVFQRLRKFGFEQLATTRWRTVGPWQIQFNPLRALRPPRMSDAVATGLTPPFDGNGFHFNRPFLRREILWEGELCGTPLRLLYNKFPFADRHGLLVPDPSACRPQAMTADDHERVWQIIVHLGRTLEGVGFGYNAHGAYASVNHLHLQVFVREQGVYPIELPQWRHNGGDRAYPLPVQRVDDPRQAWEILESRHSASQGYNLLYRPGVMYAVARRLQGSYTHSAWTGGFAWSEASGAITTFDEGAFERLGEREIEEEFARMAPGEKTAAQALTSTV